MSDETGKSRRSMQLLKTEAFSTFLFSFSFSLSLASVTQPVPAITMD